ncbi:MAG: glycosyltransferase family 4 protein [Ferruginibacter sp.]
MQNKLRIALVVSHPIQHFCPQYVSFAKNKDISLKVFFASALGYKKYEDESFKKEIVWGNLQLDKFDHVFLNGEVALRADKNLDAPSLDAELEKHNPDVVIVYGYFQKFQRRAYKWANKNNKKLAYISDSELTRQRSHLVEWLKSVYLRYYFAKIDYFLTVGDANEEFYRRLNVKEEQLIRMHFPIDIEFYKDCFEQRHSLGAATRQQHNIHPDEMVISVVGKLAPWKNQDHIIEAMHLLEQEGIYLHLLILGSGEKQEEWEKKAITLKKSKVNFVGFVDIDKLPGYYAASDFYVHPASMDHHSIAISEAIYMQCPVVLSDRCGSFGDNDDVQPGRNGYVYQFGNIPELAEKIKLLFNSAADRKRMGEYSHTIAVQFQEKAHYGVINSLIRKVNNPSA